MVTPIYVARATMLIEHHGNAVMITPFMLGQVNKHIPPVYYNFKQVSIAHPTNSPSFHCPSSTSPFAHVYFPLPW
jgi:hypothetical protein